MSSKGFISKLWEKRIVRFASVGAINTLTDVAILNLLVFGFHLKLIVANLISASISIVISYFWNHVIVFQREHPLSMRLFLKFVVVTGISVLAVQTLIISIVERLVSVEQIMTLTRLSTSQAHLIQVNGAKLVAVLVAMTWNFILYQLVVFKKPIEQEDIDEEGVVPY